jgi:hypothetical protein
MPAAMIIVRSQSQQNRCGVIALSIYLFQVFQSSRCHAAIAWLSRQHIALAFIAFAEGLHGWVGYLLG